MKPLLVFAMKEEAQDVFDDYDVLYTGIGKINATYVLTSRLMQDKPSIIINMGTAGSRVHGPGTIVNPDVFVQRDMDVTALGFAPFQTPFSNDPVRLEYGRRVEKFPGGVCGTGDNFDVTDAAAQFDVVDMEAFAMALVCQRAQVPFLCLKYISDGANDDATTDWQTTLHKAAERLRGALKECGF